MKLDDKINKIKELIDDSMEDDSWYIYGIRKVNGKSRDLGFLVDKDGDVQKMSNRLIELLKEWEKTT